MVVHFGCFCPKKLSTYFSIRQSKGRTKYYTYYHCRDGCKERIATEKAHGLFEDQLDSIQVKPEIASLFLELKENIYKENGTIHDKAVAKIKSEIKMAEEKLIALQDKFITDRIDGESYSMMKPKYQDELKRLRLSLLEHEDQEKNLIKYVRDGVNVIQNARHYYTHAKTTELKQKVVGSIYRENLKIENGECRTTRENHVTLVLRGFNPDFKKNGQLKSHPFLQCRLWNNRFFFKNQNHI